MRNAGMIGHWKTVYKMKIGHIVITIKGPGKIVDIEHYNRLNGGTNRYGVMLDHGQQILYFWPGELQAAPENVQQSAHETANAS